MTDASSRTFQAQRNGVTAGFVAVNTFGEWRVGCRPGQCAPILRTPIANYRLDRALAMLRALGYEVEEVSHG